MNRRDVLITGLGVVSAAGVGWRACADTVSVLPTFLSGFDATTFPARLAYQVEKLRPQPYMKRRKDLKLMSRDAQLALVAAGLAAEDAGLLPSDPSSWPQPADEIALYMGVGLEPGDVTELGPALARSRAADGSIDLDVLGEFGINLIPPLSALSTLPNMALAHVSINLELMGRGEALSPWGTSGLDAVAAGAEMIARGRCEMAFVGAADSDVDMSGVARYLRMGLLARLKEGDAELAAAPDGTDGLVLGEGAAFFVLESRESAEARGKAPLARVARHAQYAVPTPQMSTFSVDVIADMVAASLVRNARSVVVGAAGHDRRRRRVEAEAVARAAARRGCVVTPSLDQVSSRVGWCVAAGGIVDLADRLARERLAPSVDSIVGLAWAPTGHTSTLTLDQMGGGSP